MLLGGRRRRARPHPRHPRKRRHRRGLDGRCAAGGSVAAGRCPPPGRVDDAAAPCRQAGCRRLDGAPVRAIRRDWNRAWPGVGSRPITACRTRRSHVSQVLASAVTAAASRVAAPALADQGFQTSHAAVHPVANAPLRSGFVNDVTRTAPSTRRTRVPPERRAARHDLPGAAPDIPTPNCSGAPFLVAPTSSVTTNTAGNGNADATSPRGRRTTRRSSSESSGSSWRAECRRTPRTA